MPDAPVVVLKCGAGGVCPKGVLVFSDRPLCHNVHLLARWRERETERQKEIQICTEYQIV